MERLLLLWIKDKEIFGHSINETIVYYKASAIFGDLVLTRAEHDTGEETSQQTSSEFKASRGWFKKFKRLSGLHSVVRHGEGASTEMKAAEVFVKTFDKLTFQEGYSPQKVFNCDKTWLFWKKKMPRQTYIIEEEKLPEHKPMKDRLTIALCANAGGDYKLFKPLLVYHSETP
ncbi:tigger transposable element-derived protein 1-like [Palaemon carinicauda]|uniref:tigger transposable element-derived protein 1-like n=1 Tax=Palaemon carinicauda TaxID=392227 RepID=UPI0035B5A802